MPEPTATTGALRERPRPSTGLPDHVTMPLLERITDSALDRDYQVVADKRARAATPGATEAGPPGQARPTRTTAAVLAAFGLLVVMAAVHSDRTASIDATGRAALITQITDHREYLSTMQGLSVDIRAENTRLEADLETAAATERTELNRLRRLRIRTGYVPVTGPGVRMEVDDAPDGEAVRDEDLAILVNGLWRAGAEAVAVNDQRLTVLSAFSNRGPAITVNSRPLNPPYVVRAIGDPGSLQADFANTTSGLTWLNLQQALGFEYTIGNDGSMSLPAARPATLRSAEQGLSTDRDPTEEDTAS